MPKLPEKSLFPCLPNPVLTHAAAAHSERRRKTQMCFVRCSCRRRKVAENLFKCAFWGVTRVMFLSHQVWADAAGGEGEAPGRDLQRHRPAKPRIRRPAGAGQALVRLLHQVLPSDQSQGEGHPDRKDDRQISQFPLLFVSSFFPCKWFTKLITQLLKKKKNRQNTKPKKNLTLLLAVTYFKLCLKHRKCF